MSVSSVQDSLDVLTSLGVDLTAVHGHHIDGRVRVTFCTYGAKGSESTWLEMAAPADAVPADLISRLQNHGWRILPDTPVVHAPATAVLEERDMRGMVTSWRSEHLGYDEVTVTFHPVDSGGAVTHASSSEVKAARTALRHFGLNRAPVVTQTWRDLV